MMGRRMQEFSTSSVREPRRFEYWRELIAAQFVDLDCTRTARGGFYGSLAAQPLGRECNLLLVKSTSQSVVLTVNGPGAQDSYVLNYLIAGHGHTVQNGNLHDVFAGELFLFDLTSAGQLDLIDDFSILTVTLPRKQVDRYVASARHLCAIPVPTARPGLGSVCRDMLQSLAANCRGLREDQANTLVEALVRVIAAAYGSSLSLSARASPASQSLLLTRIRNYILSNLNAADLAPPQIARVHGISERHLSKLFETEETTISRWIWSQRLEESRRMLASASFVERSIKQIAHACGFRDMSHFSCAFKNKFGSTPREYRAGQALPTESDIDRARRH
jgi:AraC family transcriptional regulator, positive regulator of tynA and feaB